MRCSVALDTESAEADQLVGEPVCLVPVGPCLSALVASPFTVADDAGGLCGWAESCLLCCPGLFWGRCFCCPSLCAVKLSVYWVLSHLPCLSVPTHPCAGLLSSVFQAFPPSSLSAGHELRTITEGALCFLHIVGGKVYCS